MEIRRALMSWVSLLCVLAFSATARAQVASEGRVIRDGAVIWRSDVSVPAATAPAGTLLEVTAQSERWYEVVVPASLGGRGERGLIARSQVQLVPGTPQPPTRPLRGDPAAGARPTPRSRPAAAPRASSAGARGSRPSLGTFLVVNGAVQSGSNDFREAVVFQENAEDGEFETSYGVGRAKGFSVAGGGMITPRVGVGVAFTRFAQTTTAAFSTAVPHPFFFGAPRSISANVEGIEREEIAVHAQPRIAFAFGSRLQAAAFGGPSLFRVTQTIVTDFTYADAYPYDEVELRSTERTSARKSQLGFNVGGDVAYFITRQVGVGFAATFARAALELPVDESRVAEIRVGGLTTAAGIRFRF